MRSLNRHWLNSGGICLLAVLGATAEPAQALSMREAVRDAIQNYPTIIAAQAERNIAAFDINSAKGKHYPTVDMTGSRRLTGDTDNRFGPRIRLNLWASGAIDAEIEREEWREKSLGNMTQVTREGVAFDVITAYLDTVRARLLRDTALRNLKRHSDLVEDFREISRLDKGRRFDLVQSKARMEQVRFAVAERETEVSLARESLARFYSQPFDTNSLREPATLAEPNAVTADSMRVMSEKHPAVIAARHRYQSAQANVKVAKGARGPRLDVEARAGADSFSQLTMSWPAFDISAGANQDAAEAALVGVQAEVDEQLRLVGEQQRIALQAYKSARERENIAQGQVDIAEQLVTVYREQFGIGRRNLLDLLNAYAELASAESATQSSRIDTLLARYQMEHASGRLTLLFEERPGTGSNPVRINN